MDHGEMTTGTRDKHYNLVSVLYHALHGADNCERYAHDAQAAGDKDLVVFFREAQGMQAQLAERAKGLLGIVPPGSEVPPGTPPEDLPSRPASEVPPEGMVGPDRRSSTTPGDVRRGTTLDAPIAPPGEAVPPDAAPPPGRERPPREEPPPGEERPGRRTP